MDNRRAGFVRVLKASIALVSLVVIGLLIYAFQQNYFGIGQRKPLEPALSAALTTREDIRLDMDAFYRLWQLDFVDDKDQAVGLDSLFGKPFVLFYWASWCPDCTEVMPDIERAARAAQAAGGYLQLACRTGVRGETVKSAKDYLTEKGISLKTWFDRKGESYNRLKLTWVPTALYFSPEGMLMLADTSGNFSEERIKAGLLYAAQGGFPATEAFVRNRLVDAEGRVDQGFSLSDQGDITLHHATLSEGQGLVMQYALRAKDQQYFDLVYHYARSKLLKNGLFAWEKDSQKTSDKNALLDDLRIIGSLLQAEDVFGGYADKAMEHANAIKQRTKDTLVDWYSFADEGQANQLSLAYVDVVTLRRLSALDADWSALSRSAAGILSGGTLNALPLYYPRFEFEKGTYGGEGLHAAEAMMTLLHLAQARMLSEETLTFLIEWVREGPVYAWYTLNGQPADGYLYESTATYAILVLIGCELEDARLILPSLYRMEKARIMSDDAGNGAYAYVGDKNKSFDTLCALLAWQAIASGDYLDASSSSSQRRPF